MTFSAVYNPTTSAVELSCTGLAAGITWATFYYWPVGATSIDVVRGGYRVPVNGGATALLAHHDWPAGPDGAPDLMFGAYTSAGTWDGTTQLAPSIQDQAWLKWLGFPFLNRQVRIVDFSAPERSGRGSRMEIVARRAPTAVQEVMSGQSFEITVRTETWEAYRDLDRALSVGGVMLLHADETELGLPSTYFTVDKVTGDRRGRTRSLKRHTIISLTEVAAPSHYYAGATSTWQSVINAYQTWADVLAAHATWTSVLNIPATADDVIVGDS